MSEELINKLWSWSVHTGDPLFAQAAEEIERLYKASAVEKPKVFDNTRESVENLNKKELDIVEELDFFAEAANSDALVVTMLCGRIFQDASETISELRNAVKKSIGTEEDIIKLQEATSFLYAFSIDDYLNNYPDRYYDGEIIKEQQLAATVWKLTRQLIDNFAFMQKIERVNNEI